MIEGKLLVKLIFAFIVFTIIGTLSHEFGHYFVAKFYGVDAKIHYGYTSFDPSSYETLSSLSEKQRILITFGGPIQTMLTGTIGFLLLLLNKKTILSLEKLNVKFWTFIYVSFFWLRQIANFVVGFVIFLINGKYSTKSDESKISLFYNLPVFSIGLITSVISFALALNIIFKFIPIKQRLTFILAGLIGGTSGYLIWLESLGEILLP